MFLKKDSTNLFVFFNDRIQEMMNLYSAFLSKDAEIYLSNLLVERAHSHEDCFPETFVALYQHACEVSNSQAIQIYREMGDRALFVSGYFRQSLKRRLVGVDYYQHMGAMAYSAIASQSHSFGVLFAEMAQNFALCSNLLRELWIKLQTRPEDLLSLYQEWLESREPAIARHLKCYGIQLRI